MNELDRSCEWDEHELYFGILSPLWASKARVVNEIGMNYVGQLSFCKQPDQSLCQTKNTPKNFVHKREQTENQLRMT